MESLKQYQQIELLNDLNPNVKKGMRGVILNIWDADNVEIEFVNSNGFNIAWNHQDTYTVSTKIIKSI